MASDKKESRQRRARRTRVRIALQGIHRLCVHRTPQHIYAQVIAPEGNRVVTSAGTLGKELRSGLNGTGNKDAGELRAVAGRLGAGFVVLD